MPIACSWCDGQTSKKDYLCSNRFKPVVPQKAADRTAEGEIIESHAMAFGKVKVELQWVSKETLTDEAR